MADVKTHKPHLLRHGFRSNRHRSAADPMEKDGDLWWFSESMGRAFVDDNTKDLQGVEIAKIALAKPASDADLIKVAHKHGIEVDEGEPLRTLMSHHGLLEALRAKGFDGAVGADFAMDADGSRAIVAFETNAVEILTGAQRKQFLARNETPPSEKWGKGYTSEHARLHNCMTNALVNKQFNAEELDLAIAAAKLNPDGFDVDALSGTGSDLLVLAAAQCSVQHLEVMAKHGANMKQRNGYMMAAIHMSMEIETIKWLIVHGLDIEAVDREGLTPLHGCAHSQNAQGIVGLLQQGADPNARDLQGNRPLHTVAQTQYPNMFNAQTIDVLVEAGADIDARNHLGQTPLHLAAKVGATQAMFHLISRGADIDAEDHRGLRPLHFPIATDCQGEQLLMALGASRHGIMSNKQTLDGQLSEPPIFAALRVTGEHATTVFKMCLARGVDKDDLEKAKVIIKRKGLDQLGGILNAHMASQAIEEALGRIESSAKSRTSSRRSSP